MFRKGFVRNYAMQEANEDYAETYSDYVSYSYEKWNRIMTIAAQCHTCDGTGKVKVTVDKETKQIDCTDCSGSGAGNGANKINEKVNFIRNYMMSSFGLDLDKLREVVHRRKSELPDIDLSTLE